MSSAMLFHHGSSHESDGRLPGHLQHTVGSGSRPEPGPNQSTDKAGTAGLAHRVALDLRSLRSSHPPTTTIRVKRSALQPPHGSTSRQLADQRLQQALGGQFDYIGARSMLHRLARSQWAASAAVAATGTGSDARVPADGGGNLSDSIMARVRSLAATTSQNAAVALHERAVQEAARRRRSRTKPVEPAAAPRSKPPPVPLSDLPPSMIPVPRAPITQFASQPPPSPAPTATPTTRRDRADRDRDRDRSPLRAPNKFYNVRVSQNPIFLRRTSIKPPHLASLPIPAPPLPAPPMATPTPRPRSPVRRAKPAAHVDPAPMTGSVRRPAPRAARTTSVALQTYLADDPPAPPKVTPPMPRTARGIAVGVQADADGLPTRDARDAWTVTDPPPVMDRATAPSPVGGGRDVACQANWIPPALATRGVASQTDRPGNKGRTVALDTRDLVRPTNVAVQTDAAWPTAPVPEGEMDWVGQAQGELLQWLEMQVLLRLVADDLVDNVAMRMVAELIQDVVARWPVAMGTQVEEPKEHAEHGVQVVPELKATADGATQVTPSVTPPRIVTPEVSAIDAVDLGVQTSFASLPVIREVTEDEDEDLEVSLPVDQTTQVSFHPMVSDASAQVTPAAPSPSTSEQPTPTPRTLHVPPATPASDTSYQSIGVQRTPTPLTPTPLTPTPVPTPPPRIPTPGESLPPPSSIHPSSRRSHSPGLVTEPSATTLHTASASLSMDVSEGEILTGMYSEGELVSSGLALAPSAAATLGIRRVSADTTVDVGEAGHLVAHRPGDDLDEALAWVKRKQREQFKRRAMQRLRLKGLTQRMREDDGSADASAVEWEAALTSGISLSDGFSSRGDLSLGQVHGSSAQEEASASDSESGSSRPSTGSEPVGSQAESTEAATDNPSETHIASSVPVMSQSEGELRLDLGSSDDSEFSVSAGGPCPPEAPPSARRPAPFLSTS